MIKSIHGDGRIRFDGVERKEVAVTRGKYRKLVLLLAASACSGCQSTANHTPLRLQSMFESKPPAAIAASAGTAQTGSKSKLPSPRAMFAGKQQTPQQQMSALKHPTAMNGEPRSAPVQWMQNTAGAVKSAMLIEPQRDESLDPTNLQFDPGKLQPDLYLSAAKLMEERGQFPEAAAHYEHLLTMQPQNRAALIGSARLAHRMGNLDKAIAGYQRAVSVIGNDPVVLNDLGLCLARAGRHEQAVQAIQAALTAMPDSLLYRNNLAAVLIEANRTDQAVAILAETHGPAVANYNVGYMLQQRQQYESAEIHFQRVLQIHPGFAPAQAMLDKISPRLGQRPVHNTPAVPHAAAKSSETYQSPESYQSPTPARMPTVTPPTKPLPEVVRYERTDEPAIRRVQHVVDVPQSIAEPTPADPPNIVQSATIEPIAAEPTPADPTPAEPIVVVPVAVEPVAAGPISAEPAVMQASFEAAVDNDPAAEATEGDSVEAENKDEPEPAPLPVIRQPLPIKAAQPNTKLIAPSPDNFE
jgi:tetratricopeptide (TPR) repeat protein